MIKTKVTKQLIYVSKYDYLHYYTRCKEVAFLTNYQIEYAIKQQIEHYQQYLKNKNQISDEEIDDYGEIDTQDAYSIYREQLFDNLIDNHPNNNNITEVAMIEGAKISLLAKEFLIKQYQVDVVIDYDDEKYEVLKLDPVCAFNQTKTDIDQLLKTKKSFILFQPTFINKTPHHTLFVTKCDCIVYLNSTKCYLIQIKGTTSSQLIHFLDLLYQSCAIKQTTQLNITNHYLCLVAYCQAPKNTIPFIIDPYINLTKFAPMISKEKLPVIIKDKIALRQRYKLGKEQLQIDNVLNNNLNYEEIFDWYKSNGSTKKMAQNFASFSFNKSNAIINQLTTTFNEVIDELGKNKAKFNLTKRIFNFLPCANCKSMYQNCPYWTKCKELFKDKYLAGEQQFYPFLFSATIFKYLSQLEAYQKMAKLKTNTIDLKFIKPEYQCFLNKESKIDDEALQSCWNKLQSRYKKVFFNFTTINSAIRCLDNTLPFSQIIMQCAISKQTNKTNKLIQENLIIDPKLISLNWFKSIIDHLYEGKSCWYIVYNKNFETYRLKEISDLLNDEQYRKKIDCICNNLFELSSFFGKSPKPLLLEPLHGYYSLHELVKSILIPALTNSKELANNQLISSTQAKAMISKRFFGLINDEEWNKDCVVALKQYGFYDIIAMQAIQTYLKQLIDRKCNHQNN